MTTNAVTRPDGRTLRFRYESQCKSKRPFLSKAEAESVDRFELTLGYSERTVYECPWCDRWHLGRPVGSKRVELRGLPSQAPLCRHGWRVIERLA